MRKSVQGKSNIRNKGNWSLHMLFREQVHGDQIGVCGCNPQLGNMEIRWGLGSGAPALGRLLVHMVMFVDFTGLAEVIGTSHQRGLVTS